MAVFFILHRYLQTSWHCYLQVPWRFEDAPDPSSYGPDPLTDPIQGSLEGLRDITPDPG